MSGHHAEHAADGDHSISVGFTIAGLVFGGIIASAYLWIMAFLLNGQNLIEILF